MSTCHLTENHRQGGASLSPKRLDSIHHIFLYFEKYLEGEKDEFAVENHILARNTGKGKSKRRRKHSLAPLLGLVVIFF